MLWWGVGYGGERGPLPATSYTYKNYSEPDPLQTTADTQKEKRYQCLKGEVGSAKQQKNQTCTGVLWAYMVSPAPSPADLTLRRSDALLLRG